MKDRSYQIIDIERKEVGKINNLYTLFGNSNQLNNIDSAVFVPNYFDDTSIATIIIFKGNE